MRLTGRVKERDWEKDPLLLYSAGHMTVSTLITSHPQSTPPTSLTLFLSSLLPHTTRHYAHPHSRFPLCRILTWCIDAAPPLPFSHSAHSFINIPSSTTISSHSPLPLHLFLSLFSFTCPLTSHTIPHFPPPSHTPFCSYTLPLNLLLLPSSHTHP